MEATKPPTFDCKPTLNDSQVLDFCKTGYVYLPGVVDDETNRKATDYCEAHPEGEPTGILSEDWFIDGVILNTEAAGAVRSLLGRDFHLPVVMSNHRAIGTFDELAGWHVDGNSRFGRETNYLQVFYYPQDTPKSMGPTEVLPGSHVIHNKSRFMRHLSGLRGSVPLASPSGTIFITDYAIWHRRGGKTALQVRNMLKYCYWRTVPPERDWIQDEGFDIASTSFENLLSRHNEQFRVGSRVAERFLWLCGQGDAFQNLGGQSWPLPADRNDVPYGLPKTEPSVRL